MKYRVKSTLEHDGKRYEIDTVLVDVLSDQYAAPLLACGAVEAMPEPPVPPVPPAAPEVQEDAAPAADPARKARKKAE